MLISRMDTMKSEQISEWQKKIDELEARKAVELAKVAKIFDDQIAKMQAMMPVVQASSKITMGAKK